MEAGYLYYDHGRTSWLRERPQRLWQGNFSDHLGPGFGLVSRPGARCTDCRLVLFEYPRE
jgi:hypothetical protein